MVYPWLHDSRNSGVMPISLERSQVFYDAMPDVVPDKRFSKPKAGKSLTIRKEFPESWLWESLNYDR